MKFSADERLVLEMICSYFHEHGTWPTYDYLDRKLSDDHDDLDVETVGRKLEPFTYDYGDWYIPMTGWEPQHQISLGISAIHSCLAEGICPEIAEDLEAFMTVLRLCVEKYRARDLENAQNTQVTSDELRDRFGMSDLMLHKVFELVSRAGLTFGASSRDASAGQPAWWTFTVSPDVRKFRKVTTIDDFLRVRENVRAAHRRGYPSTTLPNAMPDTGGLEPEDVFGNAVFADPSNTLAAMQLHPISLFPTGPFTTNEHLCFVLMPFAPALRPVYDNAIVSAATYAGLECRRADEIFKPGGIMAQVWQKLMEARVVVADLTNMNANVFYELGLAHSIGHDVILLTQAMEWVPFDLRHMRCFEYQPDEHGLRLLEQTLRRAFTEVLAETALSQSETPAK